MSGASPVVLSTRDESGNAAFADAIAACGGRTLPLPLLRIDLPDDVQPLRNAVTALDRFDWVVFTSAHAVAAACGLDEWGRAWALAARPRVGAVGHATVQALARNGVEQVIAADGRATSLAQVVLRTHRSGAPLRVLWPRSDRARRELPDALRAAGAEIVDPVAYRTSAAEPARMQQVLEALAAGEIDAVAFFSPSAVDACVEALPGASLASAFDRVLVASIGPTTSAAIREAGGRVDIEAAERTAAGLSRAIMSRLRAAEGART